MQSTSTVGHKEERRVILASSLGTVFEWYDFFLYGSLAASVAKQFFTNLDPTSGFIFSLLAFAAGFIVRPLGALFFGRLGDLVGRKYTFLVTISIMGVSTFAVGAIPTYSSIGVAAPVILICLRLLQGLALGGEYGAAATYVAEHAPANKRGLFTSFIQTTSTVGLLLSLLVILAARKISGAAFDDWGWRIPFLVSVLLLAVSLYVRMSLTESPAFQRIKTAGRTSKAPIREAFGAGHNLKLIVQSLFGLLAGQVVVWFTALFYAMFFIAQVLKIDPVTTNGIVIFALVVSSPLYLLFGALSDRIGRKPVILGGCLIAATTIFPLFKGITHFGNPALERALSSAPVVLYADEGECSVQFNLTGTSKFLTSCDIARQTLAANAASFTTLPAPVGTVAQVKVGGIEISSFSGKGLLPQELRARTEELKARVTSALRSAGYPAKADAAGVNEPMLVVLLTILMALGAMTLAPMAAAMVELFPTRIRYTSISLPYHLGNGWLGGLLPTISFAMVAQKGDIYFGLWYPVVVAFVSGLIGIFFVQETYKRDIFAADLGDEQVYDGRKTPEVPQSALSSRAAR